MKKKNLAILLLLPYLISLLGVITVNLTLRTFKIDISHIEWDYSDVEVFKLDSNTRYRLEARGVTPYNYAMAEGNNLVWFVENQDGTDEPYARIDEENGVFYTIHADEQLNIFDFNPDVAECYFGVMRDCVNFALEIGAPVINMHLLKGVYVTLPDRVVLLGDVYFDKYIEKVGQFVKMCENEIGDSNLKIAIENVDSNPFTQSQIKALDIMIQSDVFGLTLDTGHEYCLGFKDSTIFEKYSEKLIHMHLHDSDGKKAHLPLGSGKVDTGATLSLISEDKTCLVEVKTIEGLYASINYLKANNYLH